MFASFSALISVSIFASNSLSMNIGITDVGFTTTLSDRVTLSDNDGEQIDVVVRINNSIIYETTVYALNGIGYFYDLNNLVQEYMRSHLMTLAKLKVSANYESHTDAKEVWVVYSAIRTSYEIDMDFLTSHFLNTRSFYNIPRGMDFQLGFFAQDGDQSPAGHYDLTFRLDNGEVVSARIDNTLTDHQTTRIYYLYINSESLEIRLKQLYPNDNPVVLGGSVIHGYRTLDFYFVDEQPIMTFSFLNVFNMFEYYFVYGKQTVKTAFTQMEGVTSGTSCYYNQSSERKVQVETVPLSQEEALWMNEFLGSWRIVKVIPPDNDREILLSDVTSEISDSSKELVTIKFSWKYADPYIWKIYGEDNEIFRYNYSEAFS